MYRRDGNCSNPGERKILSIMAEVVLTERSGQICLDEVIA